MFITNCFGAQQWSLEGFEALVLQVSFLLLIVAAPIALFYAAELLRHQPQSHERRTILSLKF